MSKPSSRTFYPLDPLRLLWVRLTYCRRWGHQPWTSQESSYCRNCGKDSTPSAPPGSELGHDEGCAWTVLKPWDHCDCTQGGMRPHA